MEKFVWMPPSREQIARSIRVHLILAAFRRKNPDWAARAIEKLRDRHR